MNAITYTALASEIKQTFLEKDKYLVDKYVPAFTFQNKFLGDFFSYIIIEPQGENPPIFYHVFSPYDVISQKTTQQAAVFQSGVLLLNIDFTEYMYQRTGVMDAVLLQSLGIKTLVDKKILFVGTGRMASYSLTALKELFPDMTRVTSFNPSENIEAFMKLGESLDIEVHTIKDLKNIGEYDYIFCHTNSKKAFLTKEDAAKLKDGALLSTYVSEDNMEVSEDFYNTSNVNVIVDWEKTMTDAKDLSDAISKSIADKDKVITLKKLFEDKKRLSQDAKFTVFRSHGTPMQNVAALKLLLKEKTNNPV